jgi:hypothetical protein
MLILTTSKDSSTFRRCNFAGRKSDPGSTEITLSERNMEALDAWSFIFASLEMD